MYYFHHRCDISVEGRVLNVLGVGGYHLLT